MNNFSQLDTLLDQQECPRCSKLLIRALSSGGKKKMSHEAFTGGTDTAPLVRLGLIHRHNDGTVVLTKKARQLIE